jgi:hypothetical protein
VRQRDVRSDKSFAFDGGLDLISAPRKLRPGAAIGGFNYEVALGGGYRRVDGYERADGRASPSAAIYERLAFTNGANRIPQPNDLLTGVTSGATAYVANVPALTSGDWLTNNGVGSLAITARTGVFVVGENVTVTGIVNLTLTAAATPGSRGDSDYKASIRGAQAHYRALITPVPGTGSVLGVHVYKGVLYAWRNNGGGTAAVMYKATAGGWVAITLSTAIAFVNGTVQINEGDTITGATSGATATVLRVNINTGTWAGPTFAQGRLAITVLAGVFQNGEVLRVGATPCATSSSTAAAQTFLPGGAFECLNYNFYGASNRLRMYGVDGVNRAWEFDGTVFLFIATGMAIDTPQRLATHRTMLFLGFPGGSLQNSGVGTPCDWTVRQGAADIGIGADITALYSIKDDTLAIWATDVIGVLYGSSNANFVLRKQAARIGARGHTVAEIDGRVTFADTRGVFDMTIAQNEGDVADAALSKRVKPLIVQQMPKLVCAVLVRDLSQVRYFFNDKTALTVTFADGEVQGWMPQTYQHQFTCAVSGDAVDGSEVIYAGADDGYVYEVNAGTSFDGTKIASLLRLAFHDYGYPSHEKNFHGFMLETDSPFAITLQLTTELDFGTESGTVPAMSVQGGGGLWEAANWDEFFWDGAIVGTPTAQIDGWGLTMAPSIYHEDDVDLPFILQGATTLYSRHGIRQL